MKRILLIASAVAIVAGCAKVTTVDTAEPQEIAFKAYNYAATKAPIDGQVFPTDRDMQVFAVHSTDGSQYNDYFNEKFEHSSGTWSGSQYWPTAGTLIFNAVSPANGEGSILESTFNKDTDGTVSNITAVLSDNSSEQVDILFAEETEALDCKTESRKNVPMVFYHALSQICVKAKISKTGPVVYVKKVVLKNVYNSGTVTFNTIADTPNAVWTVQGDQKDLEMTNTIGTTLLNETFIGLNGDVGMLVVPSWQTSIVVTYTFEDAEITEELPLSGNWEPGKRYLYNLTFTANEILIEPKVSDWTGDSQGNNITVGGTN